MIHRIIYADAARADLRDIANYFRQVAGDVVAGAVINKLLEGIETLAVRPARHRLRNELSHGLRGLRAAWPANRQLHDLLSGGRQHCRNRSRSARFAQYRR